MTKMQSDIKVGLKVAAYVIFIAVAGIMATYVAYRFVPPQPAPVVDTPLPPPNFNLGDRVTINGLSGTGVVGVAGFNTSDVYFQDLDGRVTMLKEVDNRILTLTPVPDAMAEAIK